MVLGQKKSKPVERVFDINIMIGGAAGQGIQTIGNMLCKILFREGLYVFALQDYQSRIRGGHNTFRVRISNRPVSASTERIDILVAMNEETYRVHLPQVVREGIMIYDVEKFKPSDTLVSGGSTGLCAVPMGAIANETVKDKKLANTVALGSILGMLEIDIGRAGSHFAELFAKKGESIVQMNTAALQAGYAHVNEHYHRKTGISLPPDERFIKKQVMVKKARNPRADGRMLINGSEAGGFGMLASGVKFYSAYPMTPSTGLLNYLAAHAQKYNIFVEQAEDEIAAINMALGASFAGARSAVGTSGGGFALMVEAVSLAGITETPIVFYIIQRPGPATGLPTRTEQADLEFILHAGHGEFPRFVFAPGDPSEMFRTSIQAFNLADTYQVPVFILGDQYLADSYCVQDMVDVSKVKINRSIVPPEQNTAGYRRYQLTDNGISPRAIPGQGKGLVIVDSDEHDEDGHLTEDLNIRIQQADKRMKKYESMKKEITGPTRYGDMDAKIRVVCWGSTLGIAREVVDRLRPHSNIELVHFSSIWPFPREAAEKALRGASRIIGIENNATAQLCRIIKAETGIEIEEKILKYNGMQFFPDEVIKQINGNHS